jgi:hypothetical protein
MTYIRNLFLITVAALLGTASVAAAQPTVPSGFTIGTFASAPGASVTGADDIAFLAGHVFVGWQNGVGTKGEPSPTGQTSSTLVEYTTRGRVLHRWNLRGKIDGMGGDPARRQLVVSVNEDGKSSLYTVRPLLFGGSLIRHYHYSPAPDAANTSGVFTGGGTDAVVVHNGDIYVSASSPTPANVTAAFRVELTPSTGIAHLTPTFADNAKAKDAVTGGAVTLALTDPDSNANVPSTSPRFAGDFVLAAQADQQLVFAHRLETRHRSLTRLLLTHSGQSAGVDDVRWAGRSRGVLYIVDSGTSTIYAVTGPFTAGEAFGSLDTVGAAKTATTTEVDAINLSSGALTPFATGLSKAKGLLWTAS